MERQREGNNAGCGSIKMQGGGEEEERQETASELVEVITESLPGQTVSNRTVPIPSAPHGSCLCYGRECRIGQTGME